MLKLLLLLKSGENCENNIDVNFKQTKTVDSQSKLDSRRGLDAHIYLVWDGQRTPTHHIMWSLWL